MARFHQGTRAKVQQANVAPKNSKKKRKKKKGEDEIVFRDGTEHSDEEMELFFSSRKTVKELVAPLGVNPNPLDYMEIEDNGAKLFTMCFYVHKLPRSSRFASTYTPLLNAEGVTANVFIKPMTEGKSSSQLDKRIVVLDGETIAAEKEGDRNRYRKILAKLHDTERYAQDVESGDNQLFEVAFMLTVQADNLENLRIKASDLHMNAREKGIELHSCYGVHPEAFLSGYPTNKVFKAKYGIAKSSVLKWHVFDKEAMLDLFNHTRSGFSHKDGVFLGRDMRTGKPFFFDPYDESHEGFGVVITGTTGTGKSVTIKNATSRLVDFGCVIRSIDFESVGSCGEYSMESKRLGGVSYTIGAEGTNVLNPFEINVELDYDQVSGKEFKALHLKDKIVNVVNHLMIMIKDGQEIGDFTDATIIKRIVTDTVTQLYEERGIRDGDPDSLYMTADGGVEGGLLSSGRVKKPRPTITDFFKKILIQQKENENEYYRLAYVLIIASMRDRVRDLYYCPQCLHFYTAEEYEALSLDEDGEHVCTECAAGKVVHIHGSKAYFDGQSTVATDINTVHINYDISSLPELERIQALLICMDYCVENDIKRNSANPKHARKMIFLIDELHKAFKYPEARQIISDIYRTARKRHVSPWSATQALADYKGYDETEAIVKNSASIFLLKQSISDREFLKKVTPLTDSQIEEVFTLGGDPDDKKEVFTLGGDSDDKKEVSRKGEVCIIDNQKRVAFVKVDYLTDSESVIAETDMRKIEKMYRGDMRAMAL